MNVIQFFSDNTADEVGEKLKERIDGLLERIKDLMEKGKVGKDESIDKMVEKVNDGTLYK